MEARKISRPIMVVPKKEQNPITPPNVVGEMKKRSRPIMMEHQLHAHQPHAVVATAGETTGASTGTLPNGFINCRVEGTMISHDQSTFWVSPMIREILDQYKFLSTKSPLEKFILMRSILEKDSNTLQFLRAQTKCAAQVADTVAGSTLEFFDSSIMAEHLSSLLKMNGNVEATSDGIFSQRPSEEATSDVHGKPSNNLNPKQVVANLNDKSRDCGSSLEPSGYIVKEEFTPILKKIVSQHGDITRDCSFTSVHFRSHFLERVCSIYKELEASNIFKIEVSRISSIYEDLKDLQHAKVQVKWLQDRVDQIVEATEGLTIAFISRQIVKQNAGTVARKAQLLEGHRRELEFYKSRVALLEKEIKKDEGGLAAEQHIAKTFSGYLNLSMERAKPLVQSLVHGLLP